MYYFAKLLMRMFYNRSQNFRAGVVWHQHNKWKKRPMKEGIK